MTLPGDLEAALKPSAKKCRAADLMAALGPVEIALIERRLPSGRWALSNATLTEILQANGIPVGRSNLGEHRAGSCVCRS